MVLAVLFAGLVRSADPTRPDFQRSLWSGPFAPQLASGRVHPQLAPLAEVSGGYELDRSSAPNWSELRAGRGFAGYGLARALRMLLDVLGGLAALHDTQTEGGSGFVHGEVVPELMRVDRQGVLRLLPLAPWHWQPVPTAPARERVGHLAPERLLGDAIDCRADVFSAGVLLWEALAGRRLFEQDSSDQIVTRLFGGKVKLPELPPELAWAAALEGVAMKAMSIDPEQRYADCAELALAIETAAHGHLASHADVAAYFALPLPHVNAMPARLPPPPRLPTPGAFRAIHKSSLSALVAPSAAPASPEVEVERPESKPRARRAAWMATVLAALAVVLGIAAFAQRDRIRASASQAFPAAPAAAPAHVAPPAALPSTPAPEPAVSAAPSASAPGGASAVPEVPASPEPRVTPERSTKAHGTPAARDSKPKAAPKTVKSQAPGKSPRVRDNEAEQYGI